jgi:hypothetical protein
LHGLSLLLPIDIKVTTCGPASDIFSGIIVNGTHVISFSSTKDYNNAVVKLRAVGL